MQLQRKIGVQAAYLAPNCWLFEALLSGRVFCLSYLFISYNLSLYKIWSNMGHKDKSLDRKRLHGHRSIVSLKQRETELQNTSNHPEVLSLLLAGYRWPGLSAWHNRELLHTSQKILIVTEKNNPSICKFVRPCYTGMWLCTFLSPPPRLSSIYPLDDIENCCCCWCFHVSNGIKP